MGNLKKGFISVENENVDAFNWDEITQTSETEKTSGTGGNYKEENMGNLKKGLIPVKNENIDALNWKEITQTSETEKTTEMGREELKKPFFSVENESTEIQQNNKKSETNKSQLKKPFIDVRKEALYKEQQRKQIKSDNNSLQYLNQTEKANFTRNNMMFPDNFISQGEKINTPLLQTNMGVQPAEIINNEQYLIIKKKKIDAETLANRIADTGIICSHKNKLFCFSKEKPICYRELKDEKIYHFIDEFVNENEVDIERNRYGEVRKSLLYNFKIAVEQEPILPPNIWAFRNGLVDIRSGEMLKEPQKYFYTSTLECDYIPSATCLQFEHLLSVIADGDEVIIERIWRIIGYLLSNDNNWKAFFVFEGLKDTGKSLLANIISEILGEDAVASMGISEIGKKFTLIEMQEKKLTLCMDLTDEPLDSITVGTIKTITGNDLVRIEGKYKTGSTVRLQTRLLFGTNHPIRLKKPDSAFQERKVIVPFRCKIPPERQNKNLLSELSTEYPGIVVKAIMAYFRLINDNYIISNIPLNNNDDEICYDHEKIVKSFASEKCDFSVPDAKISTQDLYDVYVNFANERRVEILEKDKFSEIFNRLYTTVTKKKIVVNKKSLQGYVGVKLKFHG